MSLISRVYYTLTAAVSIHATSAVLAVAQSVDPTAPLDFLKDARTKAASSNLNVTSVTNAGGSLATIIAVVCAVVGLVLAGVSGHKLYQSVQDENSRENTGASVAGVALGSCLTIIGVIVGAWTTFVTN